MFYVIIKFKDYDEYRVGVSIPENASGEEETQIVQNAVHKSLILYYMRIKQ